MPDKPKLDLTAAEYQDLAEVMEERVAIQREDDETPKKKPSKPAAPQYRIHWAAEALKPQPETDEIVRKLLSAGSVVMMVGDSGSKKTWSALDLAVCVALGENWLDFRTVRGRVLLIDEESGEKRLKRRLGDVMRGHGAPAETELAFTSLEGFNLEYGADLKRLRALVGEVRPRLIVFDALADFMLGGDENLVRDTQPVFHALRKIAEDFRACILVIHHCNRTGAYRGSTALKAAVDLMILVESRPDSSAVNFTCEKARDVLVNPFSATAHFGVGTFSLSPADRPIEETPLSTSERYVLRRLQQGQATVKEITGDADSCSEEAARRAVYRLAERKLIRRVNVGEKGREAAYEVVTRPLSQPGEN